MSEKPKEFCIEELKKFFSYDHISGDVFWVKKPIHNSPINPGDKAGTIHPSGYRLVTLRRRRYSAHRLAWAFHYGVVPMMIIDHINGNKSDNRIENIRAVTIRENLQNQIRPQSRNTTGFLGVSRFKNGKFRATINIGGINVYLGSFNAAKDASEAYMDAKRKHHIHQNIELERLGLKEAA